MISKELCTYTEERYFVSFDETTGAFPVDELIGNPVRLKKMLDTQTSQMDNCKPVITGTIFGKRYSVLAMAFIDLYISRGILLDLAPKNVRIVLRENGGMRYEVTPDALYDAQQLSLEQQRTIAASFIQEHLLPLFGAIAKETGSQESHMHSLVTHNFFQVSMKIEDAVPEKKELLKETLDFLLSIYEVRKKSGELYEHVYRLYSDPSGEKSYVRNHCCLSYLLHKGNKEKCCGTCPLIEDSSR
ncbi:hypothetical protein FZC79_14710 [Rossellomorea vietnamensis]|uniref:Ferric siderophore reductase C-terminal domain-containing protein n=2 Tax=Rossellomorea TaxID=2837508 RepID=A0A5D4KBJ3_9BACI|nr:MULTISPECIES: hypothetical protein [Rossellomorea]TYR74336.1 hypothetical protein FZC79_14710 [Rossellomorea vietnamensis]TYS77049.1 hypothetical protein FZC80_14505 [Rossellomorea aquimaris]